MDEKRKVLIIGLDGGSWDLLNPLIEDDWMPNLKRFVEAGRAGTLCSVKPPITPAAWSSFLTGVNPGKHGIFGFAEIDRRSLEIRIVNGASLPVRNLWELAGDHGKRVVSLNVPMTYPPGSVNGIIVSGLLAPDYSSPFTYPDGFKRELEGRLGYQWIVRKSMQFIDPREDLKGYLNQMVEMMRNRAGIASHVLANHEWDLFMIHFQSVDLLQHRLWHYLDRAHPLFDEDKCAFIAANFYRVLDEEIGRLQEAAEEKEPTNLLTITVSDHGFQAYGKRVNLTCWLREEGFLKVRRAGELSEAVVKTIVPLAKRLGMHKMKRLRKGRVGEMRTELAGRYRQSQLDPASTAFAAIGGLWGNIFLSEAISVADRERLIQRLQMMVDPTNDQKIVRRIYRREELYHGDQLEKLPDLILEPVDGYTFSAPGDYGSSWFVREIDPSNNSKVGTHHLDGIVVFEGSYVQAGSQWLEAELLDVTPTLLYYLGLPVPEYMDGRVLQDVFDDDFRGVHELKRTAIPMAKVLAAVPSYSSEEESAVRKRLEELGYLD